MVMSLHGFRLKPPPGCPVVFPEASSKLSSQNIYTGLTFVYLGQSLSLPE